MVDIFGNFLQQVAKVEYTHDVSNLATIKLDTATDTFPLLIQDFSITSRDRILPVACINDVIHMYSFGKDPDVISISGIGLAKDIATIQKGYTNTYRSFKKKPVRITIGGGGGGTTIVIGYMSSITTRISAENSCIAQFSVELIAADNIATTSGSNK